MKKILISIIAIVTMGFFAVAPVFAEEKCVLTSVLGNAKCNADAVRDESGEYNCSCESDGGDGGGIMHILTLVRDIMTIGVGILGVIGITIVGIQYLTAGGNEEKTRKAKRRLFEIVIGLVAYVFIYALLSWLGVNNS